MYRIQGLWGQSLFSFPGGFKVFGKELLLQGRSRQEERRPKRTPKEERVTASVGFWASMSEMAEWIWLGAEEGLRSKRDATTPRIQSLEWMVQRAARPSKGVLITWLASVCSIWIGIVCR